MLSWCCTSCLIAGGSRHSFEWPLQFFTKLCVSRRLFTEPTSSCPANCVCGARARFSASEQTFVAWKTEVVVTQAWRTDRQLRGRLAAWTFELLIAIIEVYRGNNLMILTACSSGSRFCLCPVQAPSASLCSGLLSNVMWCKQTRKNYWVSAVVVIDYDEMCFFFFLISVSAACLFRYNALSFVYLIYLLLIPLFPEPTSTTMEGKVISASALHAWRPRRLHPQNLDFFPNIAVWDSLIRTRPSPEDRGMRLELAVQFMKKKQPKSNQIWDTEMWS